MSEYMVEVGMNLNADQYISSMGQALNLTKQYADVAQGVPGAVQNMTQSVVKATSAVTGFNKVQSVALDTAASYEKQLSNIQAKTTITGQSFEKLAKTTKSWARDFPIGMGEATKVMETLQAQGIKSEKQMADLGKSFIKLGAATGTSASGMGAEFLQLSRTMGNGIGQFQKLSDSLVTVTAKMGGSAPGVVAFSKALAPVAATVGMSQTAVLGFSTALSKLGEDGGYAASSLNKVLLDMNRAMRDGGPELKAYSDLLGMTSSQMKEMFKTNPSEVLARFSEAVAKSGPNITRTLEALGFDSVRTTRSLTALARSGEVRSSVAESVGAYGNGSTERAAEEAMNGLTDSAERLRETMGQVVQDVGQPMLGFAKGLMAPVNAVASGAQSVTGSSAGQAVLGAGGVGGTVLGMAGNVVTAATVVSLAKMGWDFVQPRFAKVADDYRAGRESARAGFEAPERRGMAPALGFAREAGTMSMFGPRPVDNSGPGGRLMRMANTIAGAGLQGINAYQSAGANMLSNLFPGGGGPRIGVTPEMQGLRDDMKTSIRDMGSAAKQLDFKSLGGSFRDLTKDIGEYSKNYGGGVTPGRLANVAASAAFLPAKATAAMGVMGLRGAGMALNGLSSMGISPAMLGLGAVVAGGAYYSGQQQEADQNRDRLMEARSDIYVRFNDFAEATGKAGKGIVAFTENVEKSTQSLVDGNTTWQQAFKVSAEEMGQARAAGYKPVTPFFGDDKSAAALTFAAQTTLGTSATMEDVSRVMMDVANLSGGNAQVLDEVGKNLSKIYGPEATNKAPFSAEENVRLLQANSNNFFNPTANAVQTDIGISGMNAAAREGAEAAKQYGGQIKYEGGSIGAEEATRLLRAKELFDAANKDRGLSKSASKAVQNQLAGMLGFSQSQQQEAGLGTGMFDQAMFGATASEVTTWEEFLARGGKATAGLSGKYGALAANGVSRGANGAINYGTALMSSKNPLQVDTENYLKSLGGASGATAEFGKTIEGLTKALFTVTEASISAGKAMENLTPSDVAKVGGNQALVAAVQDSGDAKKVQAAVESVMSDVIKSSGGSFGQAQYALQMTAAEAPSTSTERMVLEGVMQQIAGQKAVAQAGRTSAAELMSQVQTGWQAQQAPTTNNNVNVNTSTVVAGQMAQGQLLSSMADFNRGYGALQSQIASTRRSAGVSAGGVMAQSALAQARAQEDFETQQQYARQDYRLTRSRAREDFGITRERANRDFGISMARQDEDYGVSRTRAFDDFARQMMRAEEDYNLSRTRASEDYNKGRVRAERDYNTMVSRANRDFDLSQVRAQEDFNKSQLRSTEDFNKSRARMIEDYNKQLKRMTEDAARGMYDPFKRIQAAMVMDAGQLVTNLKDQGKAIDKQVENLQKLRDMGLSNDTIKALGLSDAQNAQQLSRLVGDVSGNQDLVRQINEAVSAKQASAAQLATDQGSVGYSRMAEDFQTQLNRMDADFATAQNRATEDFGVQKARSMADFATSMSDASADFAKSMADNAADFVTSMDRMQQDYTKSVARSTEDFSISIDRMDTDYAKNRARAQEDFRRQMTDMAQDFAKSMTRMQEDYEKSAERALIAVEKAIKRMKEDAALSVSMIGAQAGAAIQSMTEQFFGMFQNSATGIAAAEQFIKIIEGAGVPVKSMSDDIQAMYKAAQDLVSGAGLMGYDESQKVSMQQGSQPSSASSGYDESQKLAMKEQSGIGAQYAKIGQAAGQGFIQGLGAAIGNLWSDFWQGLYDMVNIKFEIRSPSKKFEEVGKNVIAGFVAGIASIPKNLWDVLTDSLPSPAEMLASVRGAFKDAREWLQSFVTEDSPIANWIGKGWDKLWSTLPTPADLLEKVTSLFEGDGGKGTTVQSFLQGLDTWITNKLPGVSKIMNAFGVIRDGLEGVLHEIVANWNKLDLELDVRIPAINNIGKFGGWDAKTININGEEKTIIPGFKGWDGFSIPALTVQTGDLIPDFETNPFKAFAMGGIVTGQTKAWIGEAGYPEAVIPLNQRGADILAETMARYVNKADVQASGMERYASPVYNYYSTTQDYSTNITGAITVQSQNPDEMAQKLSARAKRARLAQPIGGAR